MLTQERPSTGGLHAGKAAREPSSCSISGTARLLVYPDVQGQQHDAKGALVEVPDLAVPLVAMQRVLCRRAHEHRSARVQD